MTNRYYKIIFTHDKPRFPWTIDEHLGHATVAVHGHFRCPHQAIAEASRLPSRLPVVAPEGVQMTRLWSGR